MLAFVGQFGDVAVVDSCLIRVVPIFVETWSKLRQFARAVRYGLLGLQLLRDISSKKSRSHWLHEANYTSYYLVKEWKAIFKEVGQTWRKLFHLFSSLSGSFETSSSGSVKNVNFSEAQGTWKPYWICSTAVWIQRRRPYCAVFRLIHKEADIRNRLCAMYFVDTSRKNGCWVFGRHGYGE